MTGLRGALSQRAFRRLAASHALAAVGQSLPTVALVVYVYDRTHSAGWVAAISVLRMLPGLLCAPLGGALADRYDRRRVLIAINALAAAAMVALAGLVAASGPTTVAVALVFLAAAVSTPYYPAMAASTPALVGGEQLTAANAIVTTVEEAAFVGGPALGGVLIAVGAPAAVLLLAAASYGAALGCVLIVDAWDDADRGRRGALPLARGCVEALRLAVATPALARLLALVFAAELLYGCTVVLLVLAAHDLLGLGTQGYGALSACFGIGGVAAIALTSRLAAAGSSLPALATATALAGLPVAALALVRAPVGAYLVIGVAGVAGTVVQVVAKTLVQRSVPQAIMGRAFGIMDSLSFGAILLGSLATPLLVGGLGLRGALVFVGIGVPAVALVGIPGARALERGTPPAQQLAG